MNLKDQRDDIFTYRLKRENGLWRVERYRMNRKNRLWKLIEEGELRDKAAALRELATRVKNESEESVG